MKFILFLTSISILVISCDNNELRISQRLKKLEDSLKVEKRIADSNIKAFIADSIAISKAESTYYTNTSKNQNTVSKNHETQTTNKAVFYLNSDFQINKIANSAEYNKYEIIINENDNTFYIKDTRHNEQSSFNIEYLESVYESSIGQNHIVYKITNGWYGNRKLNKLVFTNFQNGFQAENGELYYKSLRLSSEYNTIHDVSIVNAIFYCN